MIPEKDHHVIILSKNNSQRLDHLAAKLLQLLQDKPQLPNATIELSSTLKASLTGEYYFPDYDVDLTIYTDQGKLLMSNPWTQQPEILHGSEHSQSAYYLDSWTKLKPAEINSRGDVVIERWTGERFLGVRK